MLVCKREIKLKVARGQIETTTDRTLSFALFGPISLQTRADIMATIAVPSERIDLELTFGVKYERNQMLFMNVCCNWNEQMLQYCSTVFNNRLLRYFSPLPLSVLSPVSFHFPPLAHPSFSLLPFSLPPSLFLPHCPPSYPPRLLPDSVLCAVAVLSD